MKHKLETGESAGLKCERRDDRLDIARRLYRAMCAQYPDRLITLYDGRGRILEKTSSVRPSILAVERN
jgi:hypothetical protein